MFMRLKRQHVYLLKEEARKTYPVEACAILLGKLTHKEAVVERVVVTPNKLRSIERFEIDPEVVVKVFTEADKEALDFLGLFHSHPASAKPSLIDLEYMRLWGDAIWLILSLTSGNLAAYQMRNGKVREINVIES